MNNNMRWIMIFLAFLGIMICYIDRSAIAYAITPIKQQFHLNNTQFGVLSSAFALGYICMAFISGVIVDKFGSRFIWGSVAIIWSIATILMGICSGFFMLILLRVILGIGESPSFPSMVRATTDWLPMKERTRALSLGLAAVPAASAIGAPICTLIIYYYNWKGMFIILGITGITWSLIWMILFRNKPHQSKVISSKELQFIQQEQLKDSKDDIFKINNKPSVPLKTILTNKTLLINNYSFFAFGYLLFFGISWFPGYISQISTINIKTIGLILIIPWTLAGLGRLLCGYISDNLWQKTKSLRKSRSLIIGISLLISALLFIPVIISHNVVIDLICISLAIIVGLFSTGCFYALNEDILPEKSATCLGITDSFLALSGIISPFVIGFLSNLSGNFDLAISVMLFLNVSAALIILFFHYPDQDRIKA